ncbi:MAG: hypothetical protein Q9159_005238 [Coniocarpon cinnabarinum]
MASIINSIASKVPNPIPDAINPFAGATSEFPAHPKATDPNAPTDIVWLLDNTAAQDAGDPSKWHYSMVAAFFTRNSGKIGQQLVSHIVEEMQKAGFLSNKAEDAEQDRKRVEDRVLPFFREVVEGRKVEIRVRKVPPATEGEVEGSAVAEHEIGPSDENGVARNDITVDGQFGDGELTRAAATGGVEQVHSYTTYAAPEGWAVISDIDDTIKVTLTDHVAGILKSTFLDKPQPITGMPELYRHMSDTLKRPPFWYLSASPYNLYQFLHDFRDQYYPRGTLELRNASWHNVDNFLRSVNKGTQEYKVDKMEQNIYRLWPKRKFICLGDSTQTDPEAYAEMAKKHPGWIRKIFIRRAKNVVEPGDDILPGRGDEERNRPERFAKAFEGLSKDLWYVFDDPAEVRKQFDELVKSG